MSVILTSKGNYFDFANAEFYDYDIEEIAHALSHLCRFTGHTRKHYSVAQHSVHVANLVPTGYQLEALLHDASEAYLGDVSSPLKALLPDYKRIEQSVEYGIARHFALAYPQTPCIKEADLRMLVTEKRDLMPHIQYDSVCWPSHKPAPFKVVPWTAEKAKREFLVMYEQYLYERLSRQ